MSCTAMPAHKMRGRLRESAPSLSTQARMMWWAIATGGGVVSPSGCVRISMAAHSSLLNQRAVLQLVAVDR